MAEVMYLAPEADRPQSTILSFAAFATRRTELQTVNSFQTTGPFTMMRGTTNF